MRHLFSLLFIPGIVLWWALLTVFGDLRGRLHGEVRGMIPVELCQEILSAVVGTWACVPPTHEQGMVDRRERNDSNIMAISLTKLPLGLHKASVVWWNHCVCIHNDLSTTICMRTSFLCGYSKNYGRQIIVYAYTTICSVEHLFTLSPCLDFFKQLKTELGFF